MAVLSVQTKKISELLSATNLKESDTIIVELINGGTRKMAYGNFLDVLKESLEYTTLRREIDCLNGVREKGVEINIDTLMECVRAKRHDLYALGDYFVDNGVHWAVVARNWYSDWNFGDNAQSPEHIVCMPVDFLSTSYNFNDASTNAGGYAGSKMPDYMNSEFNKLSSKVRSYCRSTRIFENNKDAWRVAERKMRLPTIIELTGNQGWANYFSGGVSSQLPLCRNALFRVRKEWYWAADPSSYLNSFCIVSHGNLSDVVDARILGRVRPLIVLA